MQKISHEWKYQNLQTKTNATLEKLDRQCISIQMQINVTNQGLAIIDCIYLPIKKSKQPDHIFLGQQGGTAVQTVSAKVL